MAEAVDYFSNHSLKLRFPWSLYHQPIVEKLGSVVRSSPGPSVLNIGSGPFLELESLGKTDRKFTVCDIDERAIDMARELHGDKLAGADVVDPDKPLPYDDDTFDLAVSMDVVEHVPDPLPWLREAMRVIRPGGILFLTTPNYASHSLKLIEGTVLEAIARVQGFSRNGLHPSRMTRARISDLLSSAGAVNTRVERISLGWVLAVTAEKPQKS